jgi:ABC-type dipeptide/oligopeptide/nickel transport system permease component
VTFIAKRAIQLLLVVIAVTALTYFAQTLLPGNPAIVICGTAGQQCVDEYTERLNLNDPAPVRYGRWLLDAAQGDLGKSANTNQEVRDALGERAPVTFALVVYSQLLALFVAIPVGLLAAQKVGSGFDRASTGCAFGLLAVPAFIAAPPLVAIFALKLKWFNATGYAGLELWVLLLQIIAFAVLIPALVWVTQRIAPAIGRSSGLVFGLMCVEALLGVAAVAFLLYSAGKGLFSAGVGIALAVLGALGLGFLAVRSLSNSRQEMDEDASGPAAASLFVLWVIVFLVVVALAKGMFPEDDVQTSTLAKLFNQGLLDFKGLFLPALVLAVAEMATYMRLLRSDLISTLQEDYITMATAKGLSPRNVLMKHAFRPSTFSLITVAGLNFGRLIGGTLIVEVFFALPGIGKYLVESVLRRDYLAVQGAIVLITVCYVGVTFLLDAVYALLDPRIRHARVVV